MKNKQRRLCINAILVLISVLLLTACNKESKNQATNEDRTKETQTQSTDDSKEEIKKKSSKENRYVPDKETVLRMREIALEAMTTEQRKSLTDLVKTSNMDLENSIFYNDLWKRLSDPKDLIWNYVDKVGEIQIGWAFEPTEVSQEESGLTKEEYEQTYGKPVMVENEKNADSYIELIDELSLTINNEDLKADLFTIKDSLTKVKENHDVNEIVKIYKLLHDMDYFLLRYGIEDVGKDVRDQSTISKYYGVLRIYESAQNTNTNSK